MIQNNYKNKGNTLIKNNFISNVISVEDLWKFFTLSNNFFCIIGTDGYLRHTNPAFIRETGYTEEELLCRPYTDFIHPEDRERSMENIIEVSKGSPAFSYLCRYRKKNGDYRWFAWTSVKADEEGLIYATGEDCTERKKADDKIKESEERYRDLVENMKDLICTHDLHGNILSTNQAAVQLLGYPMSKLVKMNLRDILLPDFQAKFDDYLAEIIKKGQAKGIMYVQTATGEVRIWEFTNSLRTTGVDKPIVRGMARDITEAKKAEQKIKESEKKLHYVLESAADSFYVIDTNYKITLINKVAEKNLSVAWGRPVTIGTNILELIPDEKEEPIRRSLQKVFAGEKVEYELNVSYTGVPPWLLISYSPVKDKNEIVIGAYIAAKDITERKKAEETLKATTSRLQYIYNTLDNCFWGADIVNNKMLYVSPGTEKVYGYSDKDFLTNPNLWIEVVLEEDKHKFDEIYPLIHKGKIATVEFRILHADSSIKWVEARMTPTLDATGKLILLDGITIDITERKRIEEDLLFEQHLIQTIMNNVPEHIYFKDDQSRFLRINKSQSELFGLADPSQAIDKTDSDFFSKEHATNAFNDEQAIMQTGQAISKEEKETWPDKSTTYVLSTKMPFRNRAGKIIGTFGISRDITDRKRAEEEVIRSQQQFKNLVENISGVYWITNLDTNQTIYVSPSYETIRGKKAEEIYNDQEDFINAVHPEDREYVLAAYKNISDTLKTNISYRILKPDGDIRWISAKSSILIDGNGHKIEYGYAEDITEMKKAEKKIDEVLKRYEILTHATSDTIWDWNIVKNKVYYNYGITKMFGYNITEVEDEPDWWMKHVHPDDMNNVNELLNGAFEKKQQNLRLEYRYRCADNSYKHILDRSFVMYDEKENPVRIIGAMQDVSYQKGEELRIDKIIIDAQERERKQIGMELHDNVNQILATSVLYLGMSKSNNKNKKELYEIIEQTKGFIKEAIFETRRLSHQLAPASFKNVSLKDAFESLVHNMNLQKTWQVDIDFDGFLKVNVNDDIKINLYRILQEQLNNISKYAQADKVTIELTVTENHLRLRIADNGKGFDPEKVERGIGLQNISRRTEVFSGKMNIHSTPGNGCELIVELPL